MKIVPFAGMYTANLPRPNNIHRLKVYRKFMGWEKVPEGLDVLDVGASNYIGRELGITDYTKGDLNKTFRAPKEEYDVITCFELVTHVMNQLLLLENIHAHLKPGGKAYFSVAILRWVAWPHGKGNYMEYYPRSLRMILEHAGFKIVREKLINPWPFKFLFYGFTAPFRLRKDPGNPEEKANKQRMSWMMGFRPVFRYIFNRSMFIECEKT